MRFSKGQGRYDSENRKEKRLVVTLLLWYVYNCSLLFFCSGNKNLYGRLIVLSSSFVLFVEGPLAETICAEKSFSPAFKLSFSVLI